MKLSIHYIYFQDITDFTEWIPILFSAFIRFKTWSALLLVLAELITMLTLSKSSKCQKTTRIFFNWKCIGGKCPSILNKPIVQWGITLLFTSEQPSQCSYMGDNSSKGNFVVCWQITLLFDGWRYGKIINEMINAMDMMNTFM